MKYLKTILENSYIQEYISNVQIPITANDLKTFYKIQEDYIYNNLEEFISEDTSTSFYNIRNFIITETITYINELFLQSFLSDIVSKVSSFWDQKTPTSDISVQMDDGTIKSLEQFINYRIDQEKIAKAIENYENEGSFINNSLFLIGALGTLYYSGSQLFKQYSTIKKISQLKDNIDAIFSRLDSLGIREAVKFKEQNTLKYQEHLSRCKVQDTSTFEKLTINIGCPLDAYLNYCSAMFLSLATIYISSLKQPINITTVNNLLAVKENFLINQFLTSIYSQFCFALDFIYQDEPQLKSKWLSMLDSNVAEIAKSNKPTQQPQQQFNRPQQFNDRQSYQRSNR